MSLAILYSRANHGIKAPLVTVEAHISNGMTQLAIVGLPEAAVRESKDRVRSALLNTHFEYPIRRVTINLAPADLPKSGGRFDLPIALGIIAASGQLPIEPLIDYEFMGELALSGELRPVDGILPAVLAAQRDKRRLIIPHDNGDEAIISRYGEIYTAKHILDVCNHLQGLAPLNNRTYQEAAVLPANSIDLADVRGQPHAKRALEIAASGGHSLLLTGPPGTGKTMLASRLTTLLPEMTEAAALESATIASLSRQQFNPLSWRQRPFRAPHHTASSVALVGGGSPPKPGEISLAHHGVLFLDELPEFNRHVLEALREPLESGKITISRAARYAEFPSQFQLVAAMNPCPCGYLGDSSGRCHCTAESIQRYRGKISGPLLDRIDMQVEVLRIPTAQLLQQTQQTCETSATVRLRVQATHHRQLHRCGKLNNQLSNKELEAVCQLDSSTQKLLQDALIKLQLSARSYHRILRVARTIADMAANENIKKENLLEALSYRDKMKI